MSRCSFALAICSLLLLTPTAFAQLSERPGDSTGARGAKDLSGLSLKTPRLRVSHTEDLQLAGGSWWLQRMDPYLAFKMGKDLTQREFLVRDGVFAVQDADNGISGFKGLLSDGVTPAITANDQVSCGGCHNIPYRDAGAGTNFGKKSGVGRNSPHFFGSGVMEMLAWQIRQKMMQQIDANQDNWVSFAEMNSTPLRVRPRPGVPAIDYGRSEDGDHDGQPDLNGIFRVWFVDANGAVVPGATTLYDPGVAGYNFMMEVFGWGEKRFGLNPTNRAFSWDPLAAHGGLDSYDPTTTDDPEDDGFSQVSNAGFQQIWVGHTPPDLGLTTNSVGLSTDDPDGDGVISEITEGDLDLMEWYMLNSPRPGTGRQNAVTTAGKKVFKSIRCDSCHVLDWQIEPANPLASNVHERYSGDLRFFDLTASFNHQTQRIEGALERLFHEDPGTGELVPNRDGFLVSGIGTDFRHHEMGPEFEDLQYDGGRITAFRTAPLWGNGQTFPWGHDGLSMSLDEVVRRHGGDAQASRDAYVGLPIVQREALLAWLRSQVLYPTDLVPTDIDGDGVIADNFLVGGLDTGVERFNPEWLFRTPGQIEGVVQTPDGRFVRCDQLVNIDAAYGLGLPGLVDSDGDGFPDVIDECPQTPGWKDGCNN